MPSETTVDTHFSRTFCLCPLLSAPLVAEGEHRELSETLCSSKEPGVGASPQSLLGDSGDKEKDVDRSHKRKLGTGVWQSTCLRSTGVGWR